MSMKEPRKDFTLNVSSSRNYPDVKILKLILAASRVWFTKLGAQLPKRILLDWWFVMLTARVLSTRKYNLTWSNAPRYRCQNHTRNIRNIHESLIMKKMYQRKMKNSKPSSVVEPRTRSLLCLCDIICSPGTQLKTGIRIPQKHS